MDNLFSIITYVTNTVGSALSAVVTGPLSGTSPTDSEPKEDWVLVNKNQKQLGKKGSGKRSGGKKQNSHGKKVNEQKKPLQKSHQNESEKTSQVVRSAKITKPNTKKNNSNDRVKSGNDLLLQLKDREAKLGKLSKLDARASRGAGNGLGRGSSFQANINSAVFQP